MLDLAISKKFMGLMKFVIPSLIFVFLYFSHYQSSGNSGFLVLCLWLIVGVIYEVFFELGYFNRFLTLLCGFILMLAVFVFQILVFVNTYVSTVHLQNNYELMLCIYGFIICIMSGVFLLTSLKTIKKTF